MQHLQRLVVSTIRQPLVLGQKININNNISKFQGVQIQKFNYNIQQQWFAGGFKNKLQQRQQKQGEDEFKKELDFMANKPTFTLIDYKQRIIDGLTKLKKGLRAKFMTGNEQTEANLVMQKKIVNAMYDEELLDPNLIKGDQKKEIAQITQYEVSDINTMLKNYKHLVSLHKWVRQAKEKGEEMPKTQEELMYRFRREQRVTKGFLKFELKRTGNRKKAIEQRRKWNNKRQA